MRVLWSAYDCSHSWWNIFISQWKTNCVSGKPWVMWLRGIKGYRIVFLLLLLCTPIGTILFEQVNTALWWRLSFGILNDLIDRLVETMNVKNDAIEQNRRRMLECELMNNECNNECDGMDVVCIVWMYVYICIYVQRLEACRVLWFTLCEWCHLKTLFFCVSEVNPVLT